MPVWVHSGAGGLNLAGSALSVIGLCTAIYMVETSTGEHMAVPHAYFGVLIILLLLATPGQGFYIMKAGKQMEIIKKSHRFTGFLTAVLMLFNILGGLLLALWN